MTYTIEEKNCGEVLVRVEGVSKKFCRSLKKSLWYGVQDIGRELLGQEGYEELRADEFWAVKDINFELRRGECLGLIGHNGAGKSTLLRMLNGLIKPDRGQIEVNGKVSGLIALGAGFNPILTGRENIYVNGSILGLNKTEIDAKFEEIVEFAEVGEFIDSPVQSYSSGMNVRLGFAIAAVLIKPDILLLDEVLAVGDIGFVMKCFKKIDQLISNSAVILVSHNMSQIAQTATKIALLEKGKALFRGDNISEGINLYYSRFDMSQVIYGNDMVEIIDICVNDYSCFRSNQRPQVQRLSDLEILVCLEFKIEIDQFVPYLVFHDDQHRGVAAYLHEEDPLSKDSSRIVEFKIRIPRIQLSQGVYSITLGLKKSKDSSSVIMRAQSAVHFQVNADQCIWTPFQLYGKTTQLIEK